MKLFIYILNVIFICNLSWASEEITPYKFSGETEGMPNHEIPPSARSVLKRPCQNDPDIIYYLSKPAIDNYPIAILCGGSSSKEDISSIIHFHRYFLQEFLDLKIGVLTVEQRGVDGAKIDVEDFMEHYTRSARLHDHQTVIENIKANPPKGWNGKLIFLGVSEGGPIVTTLTQIYPDTTIATINWCGAGDLSWREELWAFLRQLVIENPECPHQIKLNECQVCLKEITQRNHYDSAMDGTIQNPSPDLYFLNMTYKYHADALLYPSPDYDKIRRTPFLVVAGVQDSFIDSSDAFVEKAQKAGVPISYLRIEDMDHYVRKRPDIIEQSFEWLKKQLYSKVDG